MWSDVVHVLYGLLLPQPHLQLLEPWMNLENWRISLHCGENWLHWQIKFMDHGWQETQFHLINTYIYIASSCHTALGRCFPFLYFFLTGESVQGRDIIWLSCRYFRKSHSLPNIEIQSSGGAAKGDPFWIGFVWLKRSPWLHPSLKVAWFVQSQFFIFGTWKKEKLCLIDFFQIVQMGKHETVGSMQCINGIKTENVNGIFSNHKKKIKRKKKGQSHSHSTDVAETTIKM